MDNALLSFDRTDTDNGLTLANTISGTGSAARSAPAPTTLSADNNTYRGGTTVSAGTLEDGVADALSACCRRLTAPARLTWPATPRSSPAWPTAAFPPAS